jgi:hypothetical protein
MLREVKKADIASTLMVFSIVRDELFFLPAFLDHYRGLGVEQFVFLDDRSEDGTFDYLMSQRDCAVVRSDLTFAELVDGKKAHNWWRTALPQKYCNGHWGLLVDADELIVLPPGFKDLNEFGKFLDHSGCTAVGAVMVDFYPGGALELLNETPPQSKKELLDRYPYFDDCDYGSWIDGQNVFRRTQGGVRQRLMREYNISLYDRERPSFLKQLKSRAGALVGIKKPEFFCTLSKVPLIRWDDNCSYLSPHKANRGPNGGIQLPLMHFKFTSRLLSKIQHAITSESYHRQSSEYRSYRDLLDVTIKSDASFLCDISRRYCGPEDFIPNQILRFDVGNPQRLSMTRGTSNLGVISDHVA